MKLLYAYDRKEDTFAILSHNLSDADAEEQLKEMRRKKIPVYALNQSRAHDSMDPDDCSSCLRLVLKTLKPKSVNRSVRDETARTPTANKRHARLKQIQ